MSYDVTLCDPDTKEPLRDRYVHHMTGGTYQLGGTDELWLSVTYNYATILCRVLVHPDRTRRDGMWVLHGLTGAESLPLLDDAIGQLGLDEVDDYWSATEGNVRRALVYLRTMAALRPYGVWRVE